MANDEIKKQTRPKLSLLTTNNSDSEVSPASTAIPSANPFSSLEKFQELVQDIVSFEIDADKNAKAKAAQPLSLTKARISGLESIRIETPGQALRLVNSDSEVPEILETAARPLANVAPIQSPRSTKTKTKK